MSCYRRALEVGDELGARSVAFPLISTGIFGWPRADAIAAAIETIAAAETCVDEVRLVAFDEAMHKQTRAAGWVRFGLLHRIEQTFVTADVTPWPVTPLAVQEPPTCGGEVAGRLNASAPPVRSHRHGGRHSEVA